MAARAYYSNMQKTKRAPAKVAVIVLAAILVIAVGFIGWSAISFGANSGYKGQAQENTELKMQMVEKDERIAEIEEQLAEKDEKIAELTGQIEAGLPVDEPPADGTEVVPPPEESPAPSPTPRPVAPVVNRTATPPPAAPTPPPVATTPPPSSPTASASPTPSVPPVETAPPTTPPATTPPPATPPPATPPPATEQPITPPEGAGTV